MAGVVLLLVHLLLVAWLTLRPLDVVWMTAANFEPLAGIKADLALGPLQAVRRIGEGLLLLAPLGVLLPMAGGKLTVSPLASLARTMAAGAFVSLGIELLQTGIPGQVVDVDSLLLNTAGVGVAHLLFVPAGRARLRRRRGRGRRPAPSPAPRGTGAEPPRALRERAPQGPQGATPTITRVGIAP
ncbi:VanZ family protein [Streptomyces sp. NBC_01725]|uniref:VanZ family protein n=1 Tax=Streptomyces sp. NBC_01725 TaxID=2975923 RepID=UPI002E295770|nr:VanZ family protein [Streptomyces sp. NBC_01725]